MKIAIGLPVGTGEIVALFVLRGVFSLATDFLVETKGGTYYLRYFSSEMSEDKCGKEFETGKVVKVVEKVQEIIGELEPDKMIRVSTRPNQGGLDEMLFFTYDVCEKADLLQP